MNTLRNVKQVIITLWLKMLFQVQDAEAAELNDYGF